MILEDHRESLEELKVKEEMIKDWLLNPETPVKPLVTKQTVFQVTKNIKEYQQ